MGPPKSSSSSSDMCSEDLLTAKESWIEHKDLSYTIMQNIIVDQLAYMVVSSPLPSHAYPSCLLPCSFPSSHTTPTQDIRAVDNCGLHVYPIVTHAHAELPAPTSVPFPSLSMSLSSSLLA